MKVVIVTGSRAWSDSDAVYRALDREKPDLVVEGGASGADRIAFSWAQQHEIPCLRFPARWNVHGKSAGPHRNQAMVLAVVTMVRLAETPWEVLVLAFPMGASKGTRDCMKKARKAGLVVVDEALPREP
jgi:hypothetical protein